MSVRLLGSFVAVVLIGIAIGVGGMMLVQSLQAQNNLPAYTSPTHTSTIPGQTTPRELPTVAAQGRQHW